MALTLNDVEVETLKDIITKLTDHATNRGSIEATILGATGLLILTESLDVPKH
jgi:hypothetical protein